MERKRMGHYLLLFSLLAGFTFSSIGLVTAEAAIAEAASMVGGDSLVHVSDSAFDAKVLRFIKADYVCSVTEEQAEMLSSSYVTEEKSYDVDDRSVDVLFIHGVPMNKHKIEEFLGASIGDDCQVVHGNKIVAPLISPIFVS